MLSRARNRNTGERLRRAFALAFAAAITFAAGCSSLRLGYNNADTLLLHTLDNYLDLNGQQQQLARDRLRVLLAWHRETLLRGYAELVEAAGKRVEARVGADEVFAFNLEMNRRLVRVGDQAAPDLAALALTLQPAQLDRFEKKLAEDNAKSRRESGITGGKRSLEHREQKSLERAREWFGSVSGEQRELIHRALVARTEGEDWWVHESEQRRSDLLALLHRIQAQRPPVDEAAAWLREYFARLAEPRDPDRRARMADYRRGNAELIAGLINTATPEQKSVLLQKLTGYADDFAALAAADKRS